MGNLKLIRLFVLAGAFSLLAQGQTWKSDASRASDGAVAVCQKFVSQRLKTPTTAKFSPPTDTAVTGSGPYHVTGYVDSQNSFGATLRLHYTGDVANPHDDHWDLLDLKLK
jgi:hypothetical protein